MTHIIAIGGPSCAGKTELAKRLSVLLSAPVLPLDAYYINLDFLPLPQRCKFNFDVPEALDHDLLRQHLAALLDGKVVERPVYDFTTHTRAAQTERIAPGGYLLLEGLFALYWDDIRALLHTKVFVETADPVCLQRRSYRDVRERGRTPESVLEQYEATVRPMAELHVRPTRRFADIVVSGEMPVQTSSAAVLRHLGQTAMANRSV